MWSNTWSSFVDNLVPLSQDILSSLERGQKHVVPDISKWITPHLHSSPLCHMWCECQLLSSWLGCSSFVNMTLDYAMKTLQNFLKWREFLFMHEASGMWQVNQDTSKYFICALGNVKDTLNRKKHKNSYPSAPNVICFHLCNCASKYVNSTKKHTLI